MDLFEDLLKKTNYKLNGSQKSIVDVYQNLNLKNFEKVFTPFYIEVSVSEDERPEQTAEKYYGDPKMAFVILHINQIKNVAKEWPMSERAFIEYIIRKYGSVAEAKAKDYKYYDSEDIELTKDSWEISLDPDKYTISAYAYEQEQNDNRRQIKIINPVNIDALNAGLRNYKKKNKYSKPQ